MRKMAIDAKSFLVRSKSKIQHTSILPLLVSVDLVKLAILKPSINQPEVGFSFRFNQPSFDILAPLVRYDHPGGNKQKIKQNKHASVILLVAKKIQNSTFLQIGAWNLHSMVLWYVESDGVIFVKIIWLLRGFSFILRKSGKLSQARSLWNLYIWNHRNKPVLLIYLLASKIPFFRVSVTIEPGRSLLTVRYHELFDSNVQKHIKQKEQ